MNYGAHFFSRVRVPVLSVLSFACLLRKKSKEGEVKKERKKDLCEEKRTIRITVLLDSTVETSAANVLM